MKQAEILAPAGSMESLLAAVHSGADAVYFGYGPFNARRNAKNFDEEAFGQMARLCKARGVKMYMTLNTLLFDRELEQLKDSIRAGIAANNEKQADQQVENDLIEKVVNGMKADVPAAMIESRVDELVQDFEYRIQQQGLKLQDYLKYMGMTMDAFRAQFTEQAEKQVKTRLAMEAVVVKEKIEATEEEFEAEVKRIADAYQMEADKVKSIVDAAAVKADLAVNKAIDFVKNAAKISVETEDKSDENKD